MMKNLIPFALLPTLLLLSGCGGPDAPSTEDGPQLTRIVLQTDWYAQPEHGGFYQALAEGYYEAAGLDVEILPGGPNTFAPQKIAQGTVQFAIGRSDDVIMFNDRGVPLFMAGSFMQKDPQAILYHKESGIESFADLDGRTIMASPESAYIKLIERTYGISLKITPLDYGMSRFLADKDFIQQCFITNEPYYVRKNGANPGTLLISDSGFSPYRLWFCRADFARENPEIVKAFNEASALGWRDYLFGDNTKANAMIAARNPKMTEDFMAYVVDSMRRHNLVTGEPGTGHSIGYIDVDRVRQQIEQLYSIDMIDSKPAVENMLNAELLVTGIYAPTTGRQAALDDELTLKTASTDETDLEIIAAWDGEAVSSKYLPLAELSSLPTVSRTLQLEMGDTPVEIEGVRLVELMNALGFSPRQHFVLADCNDGYQGNYNPEVIARNDPFIPLTVDGVSYIEYMTANDAIHFTPYVMEISNDEGLLDPAHKKPYGMFSLRIMPLQEKTDILAAKLGSDLESFTEGAHLYLSNCASCHKIDNTPIGGVFSTRTSMILSVLAKHNEEYFRNMMLKPAETNPIAERMPAVTHYTPEQLDAVIEFFTAMAP